MLEYILLGFLMEYDQNGYQMKQHMALGTSNFMNASYGSLYPALKRLIGKGLIEAREAVENGKYTKIYSINENGREEFLNWLKVPAEVAPNAHDHLQKLYFYDFLDEETKKEHYRYYIKKAQKEKQTLIDIIPQALVQAGFDRQQTMEYGIRYYENLIEFYNGLLNGGSDISKYIK